MTMKFLIGKLEGRNSIFNRSSAARSFAFYSEKLLLADRCLYEYWRNETKALLEYCAIIMD